MVGASFDQIGLKDGGIDVTKLQPTGYEQLPYFIENGVNGEFYFIILNNGGGTAVDAETGKRMEFTYIRFYDEGEWAEPMWFQGDDEDPLEEGAVILDRGMGLWFNVSPDAYENTGAPANQFSLMNAGEALMDAGQVPLRQGFKGVVATLSANIDVTKINPVGFENFPYFQENGVNGEFYFIVLNNGGGTAVDPETGKRMEFTYIRFYDEGEWAEPMWFQGDDEDPLEEGAVTIQMGEALWVNTSPDAYENTGAASDAFKFEFPGIDDL